MCVVWEFLSILVGLVRVDLFTHWCMCQFCPRLLSLLPTWHLLIVLLKQRARFSKISDSQVHVFGARVILHRRALFVLRWTRAMITSERVSVVVSFVLSVCHVGCLLLRRIHPCLPTTIDLALRELFVEMVVH